MQEVLFGFWFLCVIHLVQAQEMDVDLGMEDLNGDS